MALGLGTLGLPPEQFWRMTPRELERALAGVLGENAGQTPISRRSLETLMHRFPDVSVQKK